VGEPAAKSGVDRDASGDQSVGLGEHKDAKGNNYLVCHLPIRVQLKLISVLWQESVQLPLHGHDGNGRRSPPNA